ncbi:MAG: DUF1761 domain-containing protein [Bacteroidota bacterium]
MNFLAILVAALVPMVMGFIWYNPKVLGKAWMQAAGITEDKMKGANMAVIFGVSFVLSFLLSFSIQFMVIHQYHFGSMLFKTDFMDPNTELGGMYKTIMDQYGSAYRTFKHGALHGFIGGLFVATPILATNALFERKGFKYIAINCGYWIITMMIMGGIVSAWM